MLLRLYLPLFLLSLSLAATQVMAAGYSCQFTRYCVATAPCMVPEKPMVLKLDPADPDYWASVNGHALSEEPFRVVIEPTDETGLFLLGAQEWGSGIDRWLLSIRTNGDAMMTVHRTRAFGEIETRTGTCRELE